MSSVIFAAAVVCTVSGIIGILAPDGKGALKEQISFACAIAVSAALLYPALGIIRSSISNGSPAIPPFISESGENEAAIAIARLTCDNICREMERQVSEEFGIVSPHLTLELDVSDTKSIVILSGTLKGSGDLEDAAEYIAKTLGCTVTWEDNEDG